MDQNTPRSPICPNVFQWIIICCSLYFQIILLASCETPSCYFRTLLFTGILCLVGAFCLLTGIFLFVYKNQVFKLFIISVLSFILTLITLAKVSYDSNGVKNNFYGFLLLLLLESIKLCVLCCQMV